MAAVFLLVLAAFALALARYVAIPYPIVLVVAGSLVGFVPGVPSIELAPDLVLSVILPPLLYNAASVSSLRDLRQHGRVIGLNAVLLVLVTTCVVAVVAHACVPGLPWGAAFALGAIVSPTDPLAATQIARRVGLPQRMITVIEGESLVNDGSSLVVYQTAVAVVGGSAFELWRTGGLFVGEVVGGVVIGVVVGKLVNLLLAHTGRDQLLQLVLSLAAGYLAYLPAEEAHVSGVLAVVACGLAMSRSQSVLGSSTSRLRNEPFWDTLVFLLNALLFAGVGLELPQVIDSQDRTTGALTLLALAVAGTVVVTRLVWTHVMTGVLRTLDRRAVQRERRASWQNRTVNSWCGLRGAVSLAAALALPNDFPERDLLIFLALAVIWVTLVLQGLSLPWVIRLLGVTDDGQAAREELHARKAATRAALESLEQHQDADWVRADTLERMQGMYEFRRRRLMQRAGRPQDDEDSEERSRHYQRLVREVIAAQHAELLRMRDTGEIGDEALRAVQRDLDLEEERLDA